MDSFTPEQLDEFAAAWKRAMAPAAIEREWRRIRRHLPRRARIRLWRENRLGKVVLHKLAADLAAIRNDHPDYRQDW